MNTTLTPKHRIEEVTLRVTDAAGNPLAGKKLAFKQQSHAFKFGCGAFDFIMYPLLENPEFLEKARKFVNPESVKDRIGKWLDVFNYGTLPFYWGQFEREEGKPDIEGRMKAAEFMKSKGITVKGHPLCWHTVCADWLMKYDNGTILKKQLERINRDVTAFKGVVDIWDVINEVVIMPIFDKYDNAITRICKEKGRVELVRDVFAVAKEANPNATFLINDFNTSISYEILIDGCLNAGVPITAIGIQSHQHQGYWGEKKLKEVLERFSHFGLPIHFTENTLISGDLMPAYIEDLNDWQVPEWPSTPEGEERQKNEWEEMLRILYDNPLVEAVTGWDFTDGAWLGAPSGFLRKDNSVKPAYEQLKKMIKDEWWTDCEVVTDENGYVKVAGVRGEYKLIDGEASADIKLEKNMPDTLNITL